MRHSFIALALALVSAGGQAASFDACQGPEARARGIGPRHLETFRDAAQLLSKGRFAGAYGRLAVLADLGHLPSAQMALVMVRQGALLFGSEWTASDGQIARWSVLVGCEALRSMGAAVPSPQD